MAKPYKNLREKMSPDSRARAELKAKALIHEIRLSELREAIEKTQAEIAREMGVTQAAVSQIENGKQGILLSTLANYLKAIGAELVVSARFQDEDVRLSVENLIPRQLHHV
jgi:transcriptional regulator with XRE-family HTH domain